MTPPTAVRSALEEHRSPASDVPFTQPARRVRLPALGHPAMPPRRAALSLGQAKPVLERLYRQFDRVESAADPIHLVRRYSRSRGPGGRRLLRDGPGIRTGGQRSGIDRGAAPHHGRLTGQVRAAFRTDTAGPFAHIVPTPLDRWRRPGDALRDPATDDRFRWLNRGVLSPRVSIRCGRCRIGP